MKHIFLILILATICSTTSAQQYVQSNDVLSEDYVNTVHDVQAVRLINGGSVIIPQFDESCPELIKAPIEYACKIMAEYMPPCLPLTVRISCSTFTGRNAKLVSKVSALSKEDFGYSAYYDHAQMSVIKGVVLAEYVMDSSITYIGEIQDASFFTELPDIEIYYNEGMFDDISFSLEPNPGEKYDFVSIVLRDLLKGLGLSSGFRYISSLNQLVDPERKLTPFETFIDNVLKNKDNPAARLEAATQGSLVLSYGGKSLTLNAPAQFENGVSLNYFIPQEGSCVSEILSYDFCKGMVTRSLADGYSKFIFEDLLGWIPDFQTSSSTPTTSSAGSSSLLMPYNGSISFNDTDYGVTTVVESDTRQRYISAYSTTSGGSLFNYLDQFHPFLYEDNGYVPVSGTSICILKKDGTWDLVYYVGGSYFDFPKNMSDWTFHCDESEYARTVEGYLRARITEKEMVYGGRYAYRTKYFVADYLPQTVVLNCSIQETAEAQSLSTTATQTPVRIHFSNTEGLTRIVLERLRQGSRLPSKIEVEEFKKGYFDTTIDRATTFTAVGYNANGTSRSVPITVEMPTSAAELSFTMNDTEIAINSSEEVGGNYLYTITPLSAGTAATTSGVTTDKVDISNLATGVYVLTVSDTVTGACDSFKFVK